MIHYLKTDPELFEEVRTGRKTFEIRREDDRKFNSGDELILQETKYTSWEMSGGVCPLVYTKRELSVTVGVKYHSLRFFLLEPHKKHKQINSNQIK